jgi:hypothetical protein
MNLTSQQVAEKLGVERAVVTRLAQTGKLPNVATHQTPSGRVNYRFDEKAVAEFKKTYVPVKRASAKTQYVKPGNGHAKEFPLPFVHDGHVIQLLGRLDAVEEKLEALTEALSNLVEAWK